LNHGRPLALENLTSDQRDAATATKRAPIRPRGSPPDGSHLRAAAAGALVTHRHVCLKSKLDKSINFDTLKEIDT